MNRETVLAEHRNGVALITMNRPEKRNAFNDQQYDDLRAALTDARNDDAIKVAVLTGAPGAFSGGQDLGEMATVRAHSDGQPHGFVPFIDCLSTFDKPLIAAVNGVGVGVGLTMLLHCDVVYIARSARLRAPFVSLGLVPEAASSYLLQAIVGPQRAAELLYTNAWIDADRAVELKLAAAAFADGELLAGAMAKASEIAKQPLASLRRTKQTLLAVRADAVTAARRREDAAMAASLGGPANIEAIRAFREKRTADFRGM
ncbi:MAG: enoyl-CoA hydratase/isomerase family protein [Chloroflexi bacterium]|nr:enoyl-CoA hydratase/isomerase family protein [Chloroflexota bacterium]